MSLPPMPFKIKNILVRILSHHLHLLSSWHLGLSARRPNHDEWKEIIIIIMLDVTTVPLIDYAFQLRGSTNYCRTYEIVLNFFLCEIIYLFSINLHKTFTISTASLVSSSVQELFAEKCLLFFGHSYNDKSDDLNTSTSGTKNAKY